MNSFLLHLVESGHAAVPPFVLKGGQQEAAFVDGRLALEIDRRERLEFPGAAPDLSLPALQWAATTLYQACQLLVCRDVSAEETTHALAAACPQGRSPETHYSVDLVLRYLPDLLANARRLAAGDALVEALTRIAWAWPLSSVGVPGLKPEDLSEVDTLISHRGLRQLYSDRIIQHGDAERLRHPGVRAAVGASLGDHAGALAPSFGPLLDPIADSNLSPSQLHDR